MYASKRTPNKWPDMKSVSSPSQHRIWTRFVVVMAVFIYIWYTGKDGKETSLGKQQEVLKQRGQAFQCHPEYAVDVAKFPNCAPKKCGRYISDNIVNTDDVKALYKIAKRGFALGGSDGGASIFDIYSGALSYGQRFVDIYSLEEAKQVFTPDDLVTYNSVKTKIQHAVAETFKIDPDTLHLTYPTFFSKINNLDAKTFHDEYWHMHVDKEVYHSFHYTSLLYLSDFEKDFTGGRLIFVDNPKNNVTVEPRKGRVTMFTSGKENPHFVERVRSGTRFAVTISFTCDIGKAISERVVP